MSVMDNTQQELVEKHLYLVRNIVLSTITINESIQGLGYEDLYQTGCEALCHAAISYHADRGASFATFADVVIKNKLISHCRKVTRVQNLTCYLDAPITEESGLTYADTLCDENNHSLPDTETFLMLSEAEKRFTGVTKKGVNALRLKYMGHTGVEIARFYNVKPNHVAAWITKAVHKLRNDFYLSCITN